jgi:hypothetical protein
MLPKNDHDNEDCVANHACHWVDANQEHEAFLQCATHLKYVETNVHLYVCTYVQAVLPDDTFSNQKS